MGPAQSFAGGGDFIVTQRGAMGCRCSLLGWRAISDHRAAGDQRRGVAGLGIGDGLIQRFGVMPVDLGNVPAAGLEPGQLIVRDRKVGTAIDGDGIVVEQDDQTAKLEMPGHRDGLVADALHQAAIAGKHISVVIDQIIAIAGIHHALGQRHADRIGNPLSQRAGGCFDTGGVSVFGMARRAAAQGYLPQAALPKKRLPAARRGEDARDEILDLRKSKQQQKIFKGTDFVITTDYNLQLKNT